MPELLRKGIKVHVLKGGVPEWLAANYFQAPAENTWVAAIEAGVARRLQGPLPLRAQFRATLGGNLRRIWDRKRALGQYDRTLGGYLALAVGLPLRGAVRRYRAVRSRLIGPAVPAAELVAPRPRA